MSDSDIFQQLMRLRQATELVGVLHEAQLFQMKMWCRILFDKDSTVEVVNKPNDKCITYIVRGKTDNLHEKSKNVCDWTRTILGDRWMVQVKDKSGKRSKTVYTEGEQ